MPKSKLLLCVTSCCLWLLNLTTHLGCGFADDLLNDLIQNTDQENDCENLLIDQDLQKLLKCEVCFPDLDPICTQTLHDWRNDLQAKFEYCIIESSSSPDPGQVAASCMQAALTVPDSVAQCGCEQETLKILDFAEDSIECLNKNEDGEEDDDD